MAEARIDLARLKENIGIVRERIGETKLLFPVKADAYGHGAIGISRAAEEAGVDILGVANLFEAQELRGAGIKIPIMTLSASRPDLAAQLIENKVTVTVSTPEMMVSLQEAALRLGKKAKAHVKVDTGMGRNGVLSEETVEFMRELDSCSHIDVEGIFTHFSVSYSESEEDQSYTRLQICRFNELLDELKAEGTLPPLCHIANSSGLVQFEDEVTSGYYNLVRPGVLLYGYPEVTRTWTEGIKPPMSLITTVISVKMIPVGRYIGYGRKYKTPSDRVIATLPVGYADGINPRLAEKGEVIIHGMRAAFVGGLSMDQLTVDVTDIANVKVGDEVEMISDSLHAEEVAQKMGAKFTEVVLTALSRRVERVYIP
jgi:alanine racemase